MVFLYTFPVVGREMHDQCWIGPFHSLANKVWGHMVCSDITIYIRPLYNQNNHFNKFSRKESNGLHFSALLFFLESLFILLFCKKCCVCYGRQRFWDSTDVFSPLIHLAHAFGMLITATQYTISLIKWSYVIGDVRPYNTALTEWTTYFLYMNLYFY